MRRRWRRSCRAACEQHALLCMRRRWRLVPWMQVAPGAPSATRCLVPWMAPAAGPRVRVPAWLCVVQRWMSARLLTHVSARLLTDARTCGEDRCGTRELQEGRLSGHPPAALLSELLEGCVQACRKSVYQPAGRRRRRARGPAGRSLSSPSHKPWSAATGRQTRVWSDHTDHTDHTEHTDHTDQCGNHTLSPTDHTLRSRTGTTLACTTRGTCAAGGPADCSCRLLL